MRALITASFEEAAKARLARHMEVVHEDWKRRHAIYFDGNEFAEKIRQVGADVLIVEADLVHAEVLERCPLHMIGCCRGDPVNIDLALATRKGIPVFHAPGRNADAVADLTLAFLLALARHLGEIHDTYRGGSVEVASAGDYLKLYARFTGVELGGRVVGLVGLGAVGREVAARLLPFKARVLAYDPYVTDPPPGVRLVDLDTLLRESDFVSLHAPVTPETQGLLSGARLALLKQTACVVNTARAALTDEDALHAMLRDGRLAGAALDVLDAEPLQPGNRFLALPNVIVTPHIGGATVDVVRHQSEIVVDAIERHLSGERPRWVANPAVLEKVVLSRDVECILTLDAGTGSGRCIAVDPTGRQLGAAQEPFTYRCFEHPEMPFLRGFDLEPDLFWGALARCARTVVGQLGTAHVRAVIAASQREGCVLLDREGAVLYAGPNLDARGVAEGVELHERIGLERLHAISGHAPAYIFPIARYLWFRKHHDAGRVARLLMLNDWITYLLSGEQVAEHSNAGESMLYDVSRRAWASDLLDELDIPAGILPPLCEAGTRVGAVTAEAAAATGIRAGTPVFAGGADTQSGLLGSGAYRPGDVGAVIGTTGPVQMVTDAPILDPGARLWTSPHVIPGRWVLESNGGDTGGAYRWLLELVFGATDTSAHAAAETAMAEVAPGVRQFFCHLGPVIFNLGDMSPFKPAGFLFRFPLVHTDRPGRGEILHAYLESVAFAIRGNCEQITAVSGRPVSMLHASGGMTKSPTLVSLLANTLGAPVAVATMPESASLGSAILAAVGAGLHASLPAAVQAMSRTLQIDPQPERAAEQDARYRRWRELYDTLQTWTL